MSYTAAMKFPVCISLAMVLCGLAACGYKGPLYYPDAGPEAVEQDGASATSPTPATQDDDRDERRATGAGPT